VTDRLRLILALPGPLGQLVHQFLFDPAADADPDRVATPGCLADGGGTLRAQALEAGLWGGGISPQEVDQCLAAFDWASPLHRLALVPRGVLEGLAWRLGLAVHREVLCRIVLRDELRAIQSEGVESDHLSFVYRLVAETDADRSQPTEIDSVVVDARDEGWPSRIFSAGWASIAGAARSMPALISARFQLKLPRQIEETASAYSAQSLGNALFETIRSQVVAAWKADFDSSLAALAASGR
jgi:hypothetical protein